MQLTSMVEAGDAVARLNAKGDFIAHLLDDSTVVAADDSAWTRHPVNVLPVGGVEADGDRLDLDVIGPQTRYGGVIDQRGLAGTLDDDCLLRSHGDGDATYLS